MRRYGQGKLLNLSLGFIAVGASVCSLAVHRGDPTIVIASIYLAVICTTDSIYGKITNPINLILIVIGFSLGFWTNGYSGLVLSLSGMVLGASLLLLPYMMGGFGAGDVKALAALGALIGPYDLLHVFVYMAFYGAGLALLYNLISGDLRHKLYEGFCSVKASAKAVSLGKPASGSPPDRQFVRFPYATAIAFGYYTFIFGGGVL